MNETKLNLKYHDKIKNGTVIFGRYTCRRV